MAKLAPLPDWTGRDAYCIGGGWSLRGFDYTQLKPLETIGCNQAFELGSDICKVATFGDYKFWLVFSKHLAAFDGWVVTNYLQVPRPEWLHYFERLDEGLANDGRIGWNANTGAAAINFALYFGAKRVFLLGYDNCFNPSVKDVRDSAKTHWHNRRIEIPKAENYDRFMAGMYDIQRAMSGVYPDRQIINVSNGASRLKMFPIQTFEECGFVPPPVQVQIKEMVKCF